MNKIPENCKYFYTLCKKYEEYEVRFYDKDYKYLKSIYNTDGVNYTIGYENCLRDIGYQEVPEILQKAEQVNPGGVKYYKTLFLGSDKWQVSLYDCDNRIIDDVFCANNHVMLGYTNCLERFGCKEI